MRNVFLRRMVTTRFVTKRAQTFLKSEALQALEMRTPKKAPRSLDQGGERPHKISHLA